MSNIKISARSQQVENKVTAIIITFNMTTIYDQHPEQKKYLQHIHLQHNVSMYTEYTERAAAEW